MTDALKAIDADMERRKKLLKDREVVIESLSRKRGFLQRIEWGEWILGSIAGLVAFCGLSLLVSFTVLVVGIIAWFLMWLF